MLIFEKASFTVSTHLNLSLCSSLSRPICSKLICCWHRVLCLANHLSFLFILCSFLCVFPSRFIRRRKYQCQNSLVRYDVETHWGFFGVFLSASFRGAFILSNSKNVYLRLYKKEARFLTFSVNSIVEIQNISLDTLAFHFQRKLFEWDRIKK